jgi:MFS family permease
VRSSRALFLLLPVIYLGYISLGLPDGTFGVAWPRMHGDLSLPLGLGGTLALVGTLFSAVSSFSSGRIIARFHTGPVVMVSCLLTGSGLMLLSHAQGVWWLWLSAVPLGFGAGAVDTGLNGYVARHYSGRHMNWLHACWGIGATCGPIIMTAMIGGSGGWRGGFFVIASVQLALAVVFLLTLRLWDAAPTRSFATSHGAQDVALPSTPANSEAGWLSAVIFALYVAVEGTAGIWAGSILVVARGIPQGDAGACVAAYYGSITTGRVLVGFIVDRLGSRRVIGIGLVIALAGAALFTEATSTPTAAAALVLLGLGFAPVYPCLMHEVPRRFAAHAAMTVIARQSGASYFGAALLPAAAGWLAEEVSLNAVTWAIAVGVVLLAIAIKRLDRIT